MFHHYDLLSYVFNGKGKHGKSEGKGIPEPHHDDAATGAAASPKGKGKNHSKGKQGKSSASEWVEVRWKVRPSDLDDGPALAQADDEKTLVDFFSIFKGGCDKNSLLNFAGPCGPALGDIQQRHPVKMKYLPGTLRGQTRLRRCWVVGFNPDEPDFKLTMAPEAEAVSTPKPQQRYNAADTVVLRAAAAMRFLEADQMIKGRKCVELQLLHFVSGSQGPTQSSCWLSEIHGVGRPWMSPRFLA